MDSELQSVFIDVMSLPTMITRVSDVDRALCACSDCTSSRITRYDPASYGYDLGGVESIVADSVSGILNSSGGISSERGTPPVAAVP